MIKEPFKTSNPSNQNCLQEKALKSVVVTEWRNNRYRGEILHSNHELMKFL